MTRKIRILIIEDEVAIRTGLIDVFIYHGFDVDSADDGLTGLEKALTGQFDLILLDIMLPGKNGFDVCDEIRRHDAEQPIIMLTARVSDEDIVQGLRLGADDYVAKPFSVEQLVLRVQAVLRRAKVGVEQSRHIELDGITIDTANLTAQRGDEVIQFTRREMDIVQFLHANHDRPVAREELLTQVWGYAKNLDIETRTVDIHIAKLRRKLEAEPKQPRHLLTIRGAGYRLVSVP